MNAYFVTFVVGFPVSGIAQSSGPVPATGNRINVNLRKDKRYLPTRKMWDCEKLQIRHLTSVSG
jgi:hypothetical protein